MVFGLGIFGLNRPHTLYFFPGCSLFSALDFLAFALYTYYTNANQVQHPTYATRPVADLLVLRITQRVLENSVIAIYAEMALCSFSLLSTIGRAAAGSVLKHSDTLTLMQPTLHHPTPFHLSVHQNDQRTYYFDTHEFACRNLTYVRVYIYRFFTIHPYFHPI